MTAYRFCRTDDMALLVAAYEACRGPEDDVVPALDLPGFKVLVRELDLWCSSCMVAFEGREPVGVLLGAKRATSTLVYGLRVTPAHRRKGHGRHLLTSLGQKLAILGPSLMVAEVPADRAAARGVFAACGYRLEGDLRDWRRPANGAGRASRAPGEGLSSLSFSELRDAGALHPLAAPWARDLPALEKRAERLAGLALHSPERLEAWALFERRTAPEPWRVLRLRCEPGAPGPAGLALVVEEMAREAGASDLLFERAGAGELPPEDLQALGFSPGAEHFLFTSEAKAA
jgi:GNAT superfamily N-acetyltransferase